MDRNRVKSTMNRKLSRFLYRARQQSRESAGQVAATLGISESALRAMEARPAEVPCRELYRLFKHYGPEQMHRAQLVLIDAQASLLPGNRESRFGLNSWKWELPVLRSPRWAKIFLAAIRVRLCSDLLKLLTSFVIFR